MKESEPVEFVFRKAISDNNIDKVKAMIDDGFDVNKHGKTGINTVMTSYLCECCETNRLHKNKTAFHVAASYRDLEFVKFLAQN